MKKVGFNFNQQIHVQLTELGVEEFCKQNYELFKPLRVAEMKQGIKNSPTTMDEWKEWLNKIHGLEKDWYHFQIWEFIHYFGINTFMGMENRFSLNAYLIFDEVIHELKIEERAE